jgi:hypothetical protein
VVDREWRGCVERLARARARAARWRAGGSPRARLASTAAPGARGSGREARRSGPAALWATAHGGEEGAPPRRPARYVTLSPDLRDRLQAGCASRGAAWLEESVSGLGIPALALGGVTPIVPELRAAGAWGVVAITALGAASEPEAAAREFRRALADERAR